MKWKIDFVYGQKSEKHNFPMNSDQKTDKQYAEKGQMISELCDFF